MSAMNFRFMMPQGGQDDSMDRGFQIVLTLIARRFAACCAGPLVLEMTFLCSASWRSSFFIFSSSLQIRPGT